MAKVAEYIQQNIIVVNTLVKMGKVPSSVVNQFDIYNRFIAIEKTVPSRMERYSLVAEELRLGETTVRMAIYEMERTYQIEVILSDS